MASVTFENVSKRYPNGFEAVHELSLDVAEGEMMVLVGPSGCGKTTALRMMAGLEGITSGTLHIGDRLVNNVSPQERDVAMVFQNYALYPHMTVAQNIGFSLKLRRLPKHEIRQKVKDAAEILGLGEWLDRKPGQLSGGQRQRVAMGRAIVRDPKVFLMDEPLSNLDAQLRVEMRAEVLRIQRRIGVSSVYVTHDQTEAMTMGDRVAVLGGGRLQQCDPPQELYDRPVNLFVAAFIGSPAMNLYRGHLGQKAEILHLGSQSICLGGAVHQARPALEAYAERPVVVGIRPEDLPAASGDTTCDGTTQPLEGEVGLIESLGSELLVHFTLDTARIRPEEAACGSTRQAESQFGASEGIARIEPRATVKSGQRFRFALNPERLHFFDPDNGAALT
ncbi:MAG: sn-glycerol-3-phosphate ABC transporter ATP-binding protein UgpC [Actinomycetota bacterium]|nr:sn-glycerol-3-phosphate ABC transporter ATP-binding protein UgpC [Actinomycetota bacterium]